MSRDERRVFERERAARNRRSRGAKNRGEHVAEMTQRVLDALNANPGASYERVARLLDCSFMTVKRYVERLKQTEGDYVAI